MFCNLSFITYKCLHISVTRSIVTAYQSISCIFGVSQNNYCVFGLKEDEKILTKYSSRHGGEDTSTNFSMTVTNVTQVTLATKKYFVLCRRFRIFSLCVERILILFVSAKNLFVSVIFCIQVDSKVDTRFQH